MIRNAAIAAIGVAVIAPHAASAEPRSVEPISALVWMPQAVRFPVIPAQVEPVAPWVAASANETAAPIELTTDHAAALWLGPAELARVRVMNGSLATVRLQRITGTREARLEVGDPGVAMEGGLELLEPVGPGSVWVITAGAATTIVVERLKHRAPRLAWEIARDDLRTWIDRGGELPTLPDDDGGATELRLRGARAIVAVIGGGPVVAAALRAWRRDQVDRLVGELRSGDDPYILHDARAPAGASVVDAEGAVFGPARPSWRFTTSGPGTVVVDARATTAEAERHANATLEIRRDGIVIARSEANTAAVVATRVPGQAFPTAAPPQALGRKLRAVVALARGAHVYQIDVVGAGWVRADLRHRRRRFRELFATGDGTEVARARRALESLVAKADRSAQCADQLLAELGGERASMTAKLADDRGAAAIYVRLLRAPARLPSDVARRLVVDVAALVVDPSVDQDLIAAIVLELAERLPDDIDASSIAARLTATGHRVPPAVLAALARHLTGRAPLSAAELAWRQRPDAPGLRSTMLAAARIGSLRRLDPVMPAPPAVAPTAVRWLVEQPATEPDQSELASSPGVQASAILELPIQRDVALEIAPHVDEPARLAVARFYVVTPRETPGPVELSIDGHRHPLLALAPAEVVAVAVTPGHHVVHLDAPTGTRGFVAAPGAVAGRAMIRRLWPVDAAVVYPVPSPSAAGPVRIELRRLMPADGKPPGRARPGVTVWLHTDIGAPIRFVLDARQLDLTTWPLTGEQLASAPASAELWLPPNAQRLWLTTSDGPVYAHVAIHDAGDRTPAGARRVVPPLRLPPAAAVAVASSITPELGWVATLSAALVAAPERGDLYVARASALIGLGEIGAARRDLAAAVSRLGPNDRAEYEATAGALDAAVEPTYLPVQPTTGPIRSGELLSSPSLATTAAELSPLLELARRIRTDGVIPTWRAVERGELRIVRSPAADSLIARLAELASQPGVAATRWLRHERWQARVAALEDLVATLGDHSTEMAPLAFGLATELAGVDLPAVRRARIVATRASRWERVRDTESNAGFEELATAPGPLDEPAALALRRALLAAPWPEPATVVLPGTGTTISIDGPRDVAVIAWCRRLWPTPGPEACALEVGIDQAAATAVTTPLDRVTTIYTVHVPAGRHAIEALLTGADPSAVAAIRFVDRNTPIVTMRPTREFLATVDHPAEIIAAGPGAVGIELRGCAGNATQVEITTELATTDQGSGAPPRTASVPVDPTPAPETRDESGRGVAVTRPVERVVILDGPGSHRILVRPDRGAVAIRFAVRVGSSAAPEAATATVAALGERDPVRWPAIPPPITAAEEPPSRLIPSAELVVGQDDLATLDSEFTAMNLRVELAIEAHRRHGDAWWYAELRGRRSGPLGPTTRIRVAGEVRRLPFGLGANIDLHAAIQDTPVGLTWLTRAIGGVDRTVLLGQRLQLEPKLDLYGAAFGPDVAPEGADPMVASVYRRDHPIQLVGHLGIRARPFADQFAVARIDARTNPDFASLDQIGATLSWRGLVELAPHRGPIVALSYRPTLRFADEHRGNTFWRHDVSAELAIDHRLPRGRVVLTLRADLYPPSNVTTASHAVSVSLRWDDWRSGERDRLPSEEPLDDYVDEVPWVGSP